MHVEGTDPTNHSPRRSAVNGEAPTVGGSGGSVASTVEAASLLNGAKLPSAPEASEGKDDGPPVGPTTRSVESISYEEFERRGVNALYRASEPVVIRAPHPQGNDLSVERVKQLLPDATVALFERPKDPHATQRSIVRRIPLGEFFNEEIYNKAAHERSFRIVANIKEYPNEIAQLLGRDVRSLIQYPKAMNSANIWVSYEGQFTRAHFDEMENFNMQLAGRKKFVLYEPGVRNYYIRSVLQGFGHHSQVPNIDEADLQKFPRLSEVLKSRREVILNPGDMLYLPFAWWHQVQSLDHVNMNLNFWLVTPSKMATHPYILADSLYKAAFRRINGLYDYQAQKKQG